MKLHVGDNVLVITGKDRGKTGRILRVLRGRGRVVVGGVNFRIRHIKKTLQGPGRRVRFEASLAVSNVMLLDPKTRKPTRVGYRVAGNKKDRVAKVSGEALLSGTKLRQLLEQEVAAKEKQEEGKKTQEEHPSSKAVPSS